ncbi:hypothetical protein BS78_06G025800 [Paspalum vaginatum]|nr:hypothetical protein BS78_06G025800 [Paspalum vaginatum]
MGGPPLSVLCPKEKQSLGPRLEVAAPGLFPAFSLGSPPAGDSALAQVAWPFGSPPTRGDLPNPGLFHGNRSPTDWVQVALPEGDARATRGRGFGGRLHRPPPPSSARLSCRRLCRPPSSSALPPSSSTPAPPPSSSTPAPPPRAPSSATSSIAASPLPTARVCRSSSRTTVDLAES